MTNVSNYQEYTQTAIENFAQRDAAKRYLLVDAVKDKLPETVLDVGCGAGQELLPFLEKTEAFCVGVDFAEELGKVTREIFRGKENYAFVRSRGEKMPFADESFDVVLCRVALPYMNNRSALAEISRILRPNGTFLLKTHAPAFYFGMIRQRISSFSPKQIAYPLICLAGGIVHSAIGKQLQNGFWRGKEIYQTRRFIERECARNNLKIEGFLADDNPQTPSYVIVKC
jgi:ubiquinone/menaquinone biosynthesis C-methylase UbiE